MKMLLMSCIVILGLTIGTFALIVLNVPTIIIALLFGAVITWFRKWVRKNR